MQNALSSIQAIKIAYKATISSYQPTEIASKAMQRSTIRKTRVNAKARCNAKGKKSIGVKRLLS